MDGKTCDFCYHEGPDVKHIDNGIPKEHQAYEEGDLCELCRTTHASNYYFFPENYKGDMKSIVLILMECTHIILDSMKKP